MARPRKCRHVQYLPNHNYFKPARVPLAELQETVVAVEELEALRLRDLEGLEQEECAIRMNISRPTFVRVVNSARKKITKALVNGYAIRIEGGNYKVVEDVQCGSCGHQWRKGHGSHGRDCPHCYDSPQKKGKGPAGKAKKEI